MFLEPVWNLFDLTPEGRPVHWDEQLSYSCCGSSEYVSLKKSSSEIGCRETGRSSTLADGGNRRQ
jgi:hypothetical protein